MIINAENLIAYASARVDVLSMGELTDSVKALDLSLEIVKATEKREKVTAF